MAETGLGRGFLGRQGAGIVGRDVCGGSEGGLKGLKALAIGRGPQSVVADLVHAFGQDVLKESPDELHRRQGHCLAAALGDAGIAEGDLAVVNRQDAIVGDGYAVDISSEISQHAVGALCGGLAVDDPRAVARRAGDGDLRQSLGGQIQEDTSEELRQRLDGDEEIVAGREPAGRWAKVRLRGRGSGRGDGIPACGSTCGGWP